MREAAAFNFDEKQRLAIEHVHGPMLVVAGAGTGKTTVLVNRIVHLIREGHATPNEILAVTYTVNSAAELKQRVHTELKRAGLPVKSDNLKASTFHGYCMALLKQNGAAFRPIDNNDLFVYLRRRVPELNLRHFTRAASPGQFLKDLLTFFERCEDELVTADDYRAFIEKVKAGECSPPRVAKSKDQRDLSAQEVLERCEEIASVFEAVTRMMAEDDLGTFGHMISGAVRLLENSPSLLADEQRKARFVLIDEFQDSNVAQIRLARLLAGEEQNVFVVGDPDQAIYRFRGATTAAFEHFQRQFNNVKQVTLDRNRRSTSAILQCAFQVINENPSLGNHGPGRVPLISAREAEADQPLLFTEPVDIVLTPPANQPLMEAADVVGKIEQLLRTCRGHKRKACAPEDFAILYRQHSHRSDIIAQLTTRGIPFQVAGVDVLDTPDVRDALAALNAISDSNDNIALFRLAALPQFQISSEQMRSALITVGRNVRMSNVLNGVSGGDRLLGCVQRSSKEAAAKGWRAGSAFDIVVRNFQLPRSTPIETFQGFVGAWEQKPITQTGELHEFLDYLAYYAEGGGMVTQPDDSPGVGVQLMTAHSAKGLEFPHVFMLRATSGSFPSAFKETLFEFPQQLRNELTVHEGEAKAIHNEEERRLFYVGMTRARDTLGIFAKQGTGKDSTPPGFLRSLIKDLRLKTQLQVRTSNAAISINAAGATTSGAGSWLTEPSRLDVDRLSLSASRIETYAMCPLKFKIQTEWNLPPEAVPAMQFGNAIHTTLKAYYDAVQAERSLSRETFLQCFRENFGAMYFDDAHQHQLYLDQGLKQLGEFFELRANESMPKVLANEYGFDVNVGGIRVRGRIDRADETQDKGTVIVDYKSGAAKTQDDADDSLQLSIYALAAEQQWGKIPERIAFYNLETNQLVETTRSTKQITETRIKIEEVAQSIREGEFPAKKGFHCRWCAYRTLCPATEEQLFAIEAVASASSGKA